jgi:hypothetical protein
MIDYISISALVVSSLSAVASLHIYRVKFCGDCIQSDCWKGVKRNASSGSLIEQEPLIKT